MLKFLNVFIFIVALFFVSKSYSEPYKLWLKGVGTNTCTEIQAIKSNERFKTGLVDYAFGFLSSSNLNWMIQNKVQKNVEFYTRDFILNNVYDFCSMSSNKDTKIMYAVMASIQKLPNANGEN